MGEGQNKEQESTGMSEEDRSDHQDRCRGWRTSILYEIEEQAEAEVVPISSSAKVKLS